MSLLRDLEQKGITLTSKLTYKATAPLDAEMLILLKAHKAELLRDLTAPDTLSCLPWQLERLVSAASSGLLEVNLQGVLDTNTHTMAWACVYLTGDRDEALRHLWQVWHAWQGGAVTAGVGAVQV